MNVLITGANGFVGKNLTQRLYALRDYRDRTQPTLQIEEIFLCTRETAPDVFAEYCRKADFVVHLAGVNRPKEEREFTAGNVDFTRTLLELLQQSNNNCPVLLASSVQAGLTGRYEGSPYGQSKKAAEDLLLSYGEKTGADVLIYRLPNLFGKWCRPNYNSVVATFCHNISRDLPISISDPEVKLELVYIDDLVEEILNAIVGTRPEIIRLSEVIKKCRTYFDTLLAHTGQNYDYNLNGIFFRDLDLREPEIYMDAVGENLGQTMGNIIARSYELMTELQPDALLVLGDTNSCLSVIGAKRLHIPIFHMEAGNRCKDECLPEETNRRIVDIISDVNLAYSEHARRYLMECGCPRERTYVTGSPMAEVLHRNLLQIQQSDILSRLGLELGRYILLSAHREENIDTEKNFCSLFTAINAMAERYDMPILYSCHPRSRKRLEESGFTLDKRVIRHDPLGFHDYNCLQMNAYCVVSDSGTLPEESSFFVSAGHPFPAVCIRTSTERPEALDKGCFVLAGIDTNSLLQAVETAVALHKDGYVGIPVPDYTDENVSDKVVCIIQSYTGIVNRMVWRKE